MDPRDVWMSLAVSVINTCVVERKRDDQEPYSSLVKVISLSCALKMKLAREGAWLTTGHRCFWGRDLEM
jgi:hypothetical protein